MNSKIKQLIDEQGNFINPKTSIDALTTESTENREMLLSTKKIQGKTKIVDSKYSSDDLKKCVSLTYDELVGLRAAERLVPGTWYRITDYNTTTTQLYTKSSDKNFDIIVIAEDEATLNENANAAPHEGTSYFNNCRLEAWQLKYTIQNDTTRFKWADTTNGKGVIYYMKDENNNEAPYDFKNITFVRYQVTECERCPGIVASENGGIPFAAYDIYDDENVFLDDKATISYGVTFKAPTFCDFSNETCSDATTKEGSGAYVHDNSIMPCVDETGIQFLNNNVFFAHIDNEEYCIGNHLKENCRNNTFGSNAFLNEIYGDCSNNVFRREYSYNFLGMACSNNLFGDSFISNTCLNRFCDNIFKKSSYYNAFGHFCDYNEFDYCIGNTIGNEFNHNTIYSNFEYNTINNTVNHITINASAKSSNFSHCTILDGLNYCAINDVSNNSVGIKNCLFMSFNGNNALIEIDNARFQNEIIAKDANGDIVIGNIANLLRNM